MAAHTKHPSRNVCLICHGPITVHHEARNGVCDQPRCKKESLLRWIARRRQGAAAALRQKVLEHRDAVAKSLGLNDTDALAVAMVPANTRPTVKLPHRRKRWFRNGLAKLLAEIREQRLRSVVQPLPAEEFPSASQFGEELPYVLAGCTSCRGHCCRLGGTRAFLDTLTLQRYGEAHPRLSLRDVLRAYMKKLPERSVQGSCVFHGEKGCTLPRAMRAAICNTYHCKELKDLQRLSAKAVLIVAAGDGAVVRSSFFNAGATKLIPKSEVPNFEVPEALLPDVEK